jgi:NitT/TauT family transport system substrate-binding protein
VVDAAVDREAEAAAAQATDDGLEAIATAGDQPGLLSSVLVVREETAAVRPGQLLAFIRAWQDLYPFERDRTDVVATGIAAMQDVSVEDANLELAGIALYDIPANAVDLLPGGAYYDQTLTQIEAAATAAGWLPAPVDARALIDGAFAQTVASSR